MQRARQTLAIALMLGSACGGNKSCGPGTRAEDDVCVPVEDSGGPATSAASGTGATGAGTGPGGSGSGSGTGGTGGSGTGGTSTGGSTGVDEDEDGWATPDDCDDGNPAVNPDAEEVCGNGVDDDCNGNAGRCGWSGDIPHDTVPQSHSPSARRHHR